MKLDKGSLKLYAVTDQRWTKQNPFVQQVEEAIQSGVTFVQLREKNLPFDDFLEKAKMLKKLTDQYQIPFVINDNLEVAICAGADGVHVGQDDISIQTIRKQVREDFIVGVSVQTKEQAVAAEAFGADYLGVGTIFPTSSKSDAIIVSIDMLHEICHAVSIPVIAIGGIQCENIHLLKDCHIAGVAVISAIFAEKNIRDATRKLSSTIDKFLK